METTHASPVPVAGPAAHTAQSPQPIGQQVTYYVYNMTPQGHHSSGTPIKVNWKSCFQLYYLRPALNLILWAAWVIFLAGASKSQDDCNSGLMGTGPFPSNYALLNVGEQPNSASDCVYYFSLLWWSVWLQFVTIVAATATTISVIAKFRCVRSIFTTTMYFFIMSSVLMFFIADKFNMATYLEKNKIVNASSNWTSGTTLVLVGTIISLVFNFIYIIWNSYSDLPMIPTHTPHTPHTTGPTHHVDGDAFVTPPSTKGHHTTHPTTTTTHPTTTTTLPTTTTHPTTATMV